MIPQLNRRAVLLLGTAALLAPASAHAASSAHERYVQSLLEELIKLSEVKADERKARLTRVLHKRADVRAIALFALGTWRKKLPRELGDPYIDLVVSYTANAFITYVDQFAGARVAIEGASAKGGFTTVDAKLTYAGGRASQIRFRFSDAGNPRVKDVNVQGIWLSLQLRERFAGLLTRSNGDFAELMDYLRTNSA